MSNNKKLNVSEADFFKIKDNLKAHLKNQNEFSDYDFDGAGLNVLLDILAYSAHYNAVHTNLAFSETFLDSANKRSSVVSRAKELGYLPFSKTASQATVRISFSVDGNPNEYVLPKNTRFTATSAGSSFTFVTVKDHIIENDGNNIFTANIVIYQGKFTDYTYTVNLNDASQRFIIPSRDVDKRFLSVLHKDSVSDTSFTAYSFIDDMSLSDVTRDARVYFLNETYDEFYEVYFGDNSIGKAVENNNIIKLSYLITDGSSANGANSFVLSSALSDVSAISVTTLESASYGSDRQSTESIKYLAPFYYQSQNRAVTRDDYKSIIMKNYSDVDDVQVWGGEDNVPAYYGKVFIAIKPNATSFFSNTIKQTIQNDIIQRFNVLSVRPEIVDPDYIDVAVNATVSYNARLYDNSTDTALENDIRNSIDNFFKLEANKFGEPLYFSKLVASIDDTSDLILNTIANLTLSKSIEIFPSISSQYVYSFNNAIYPGAVRSNAFLIDNVEYRIADIPVDGTSTGKIAVYRTTNEGSIVYLSKDKGTVDYNTGVITINSLTIDSIVNDNINRLLTITVSPGSIIDVENPESVYTDNNVYTNERDQIIRLKRNGISINMIPDESV